MSNILKKAVIEQHVGGVPVENKIADFIMKLDEAEVDKTKMELRIAFLKQMNNRHKNIIDAQRMMLKMAEFETNNNVHIE